MTDPRRTELPAADLRRTCDGSKLGFSTTADLPDLDAPLGQERACAALEFGTSLRASDYNVFALGPPGLGKHAFVRRIVEARAAREPSPSDWCYVHDFTDSSRPGVLRLPAGRGALLQKDVARLLLDLRDAIPRALESEEHRSRVKAVEEDSKQRRDAAFKEVQSQAEAEHVTLLPTPTGMALAPVRLGQVLGPEQFAALSKDEQEGYNAAMERVRAAIDRVLQQGPRWHRESHVAIRTLAREATAATVKHHLEEIVARYADLPEVTAFLGRLEADVVENFESFLPDADESSPQPRNHELPILRRYRVNVVVDNSGATGAPVVYEDHPTHANLFGRVEHISVLGALLTDFNLIKAGALHRANGGYLILDAIKLLHQPFSWDELKRALRSRLARIESPLNDLGLGSTTQLVPAPIPLDVKVILVGERQVYYLLCALDPDFGELFKIAADFDEDTPWTDETARSYARLVATAARREKVRVLDASAVAWCIEDAARFAEDRAKLALDLQRIADLLREADHAAARSGATTIEATHLQQALDARVRRSDRIRDVFNEQIRRGTLLVDTTGEKVGQVNALSVIGLDDFVFARPARVTARARLGRGELIDIEREVELGGPLHSKGVLILQGFLAARYATEIPLSLSATLVFEQSYGGIEGDSASLAELCALLSAIGEVAIDQSFAITGSVNQRGDVQPVGAINEKVEGFFDTCKLTGLTGKQGVIIPARNASQLMLRPDVVAAAREGRFHVHAVETVDEALAIVTGMKAGARGLDGSFEEDSVNGAVEARLLSFAATARAFDAPDQLKLEAEPRSLIVGNGVNVEEDEERS